jgi:cytochrome c553
MIKATSLAIAALACLPSIQAALAAGPADADRRIRLLAATCNTCHGPGGKSLGAVPALAGQDKTYLQTAMHEQKKGERDTTVMRKYMKGFTDDEIAKLADYFSNLK